MRRITGLCFVTASLVHLGDHKDMAFANAYGVHIQARRMTSRAVFVVDRQNVVRYAEYLPVVGAYPNYDAALDALRQVAK